MQNTTTEQSTTPEPILTEERLGRWCDIFDDIFRTKPKTENN